MMLKNPRTKYRPFGTVDLPDRQWPSRELKRAPRWCSVDLRDGNQALAVPMGIEEKLRFFKLLVEVGLKEIEVGFPSAAPVEFDFNRRLIEEDLVPEDVYLQVLVQCREHLIQRTFESLEGCRNAIVHFYNSTSALQRKVTFGMTRDEVKAIAVDGAKMVMDRREMLPDTNLVFEYSPESFSNTELDYAVEVCAAVMEVIQPTKENPMILNLPETVQYMTPNVYADMIEKFGRDIPNREAIVLSLHTHNDRGTGTASTELGILAGADRVEGTFFGNGERTGNLDIVTVALNLYMLGIDPELDFSDLPSIRETYEACTRMVVPDRHPYGGDLVFTAFSGSHQDAIKKGFDRMEREGQAGVWEVPYLTLDPRDIGRDYQAIIRINSQSGKGGVAHVLSRDFGFNLPKSMHPEVGAVVNELANARGSELESGEIRDLFFREFVNRQGPLELLDFAVEKQKKAGESLYRIRASVRYAGEEIVLEGEGNGPINAFMNAMELRGLKRFRLDDFLQHAIGKGSATESAAYIRLVLEDDRAVYGCGVDTNIEQAGLNALVSAINRAEGLLAAAEAEK